MPCISQNQTRLRRKEASAFLRETWGIQRSPNTLAKLAVIGGGPRFQHANRIPLYPVDELNRWAEGLLSPLKSSTSDTAYGQNSSIENIGASHGV